MSNPTFEVLAQAVVAEGVKSVFTLMGNANMYWCDALARLHGVRLIHVRHEHCAVAMADGYARATGEVGVASVTCGPGFTQIITALAIAARSNIPIVVFAGEAPLAMPYHDQYIDIAPLTLASGAHFVPVRGTDRMFHDVREAFYVARTEHRPVVLGVPEDLQNQPFPGAAGYIPYVPSREIEPAGQRPAPDPGIVDRVVDTIRRAERPIILAGRGAVVAQAGPKLRELAERCGALLATTLLGKGLFDADEFGIGIAGGYATDLARRLFAEADLVIGCGASLGYYTTQGGILYKNARIIQIDTAPRGLWQGLRVAHLHLQSDAKLGAEAVLEGLRRRGIASKGWRTPELAQRIAAEPVDGKEFPARAGVVDPRKALLELDSVIPKNWDVVCGGAHFTDFVAPHLRGRSAERYHFITGFGAIGSALSEAIGIATTKPPGRVLLLEGDGSLLMHVQELETVTRHGIKLLICAMNDGAYGAEVHKFRARGMDPRQSMHGDVDLAAIARGFGLQGTRVCELGRFAKLLADYQEDPKATLWDIHIDGSIPSPFYRRRFFGESTTT